MVRHSFPLFQSHLDVAHQWWGHLVNQGDCVVDATCGNGHDTLKLAQLALSNDEGQLFGLDIQPEAIQGTTTLLEQKLRPDQFKRTSLWNQCHSTFPLEIPRGTVKLVVYNLGYLPGGDKSRTTLCQTTLTSIAQALKLLQAGGAISITAYPGHEEGAHEYEAILDYLKTLDPALWNCSHHHWLNRKSRAPALLLIQSATHANDMGIATN